MSQSNQSVPPQDKEREYVQHLLKLQKEGKIDKMEALKRFSEWKKQENH